MSKSHQLFDVVVSDSAAAVDVLRDYSSSDDEHSPRDSDDGASAVEAKQTRQARDWRPKSTLHLKKWSEMTLFEKMAARRGMPDEYHRMKHAERGPIPTHPLLPEHFFILSHALLVPIIQHLSYLLYPGYKWPVQLAYPLYVASYIFFANRLFKRYTRFALKYGTLDETNIGRDRTPDQAVPQLAKGQLAFLFTRTIGEFYLKWDQNEMPLHAFSWSTPIRWFLWLLTMDYFFYAYHRTSHEVDFFWSIHKTHHTTRHPSPLLSILSSETQEVIEIALVPLAATLLVPLNFHELFVLSMYTSSVEILGHSGIRAIWELPIAGPILRPFGCNLLIEDHDLHHRFGKSGKNYGKQTRFWDVLFGTTTDRIEMRDLPGQRPL